MRTYKPTSPSLLAYSWQYFFDEKYLQSPEETFKEEGKTSMQFHSNYVNIFSFDKQMRKLFVDNCQKLHTLSQETAATTHCRYT